MGEQMPDVFISCALEDTHDEKSPANIIKQHLQSLGFKVLVGINVVQSQDLRDITYTLLSKARAVIVIWTDASVKSPLVRDVARFAIEMKKLVASKAPCLSSEQIPFGFRGQPTETVTDHGKIVKAIEKLGARRTKGAASDKAQLPDEPAAWSQVKDSNDAEKLIGFLTEFPKTENREAATTLLQSALTKEVGASAGATTMHWRGNSLLAAWRCLTLRVPNGLPTAVGQFVPIILIPAYLLLVLFVDVWEYAIWTRRNDASTETWLLLVWEIAILLVTVHSWVLSDKMIAQRLFSAGWALGLCSAFLSLFVGVGILGLTILIFGSSPSTQLSTGFPLVLALSSIFYTYWRMQLMR
jgi:hypothetical protein